MLYVRIRVLVSQLIPMPSNAMCPDRSLHSLSLSLSLDSFGLSDYAGNEWSYIFYLSIVGFLVYTLGIPTLWAVLTINAWRRGTMHEPLELLRIGFLYEAYRKGLWMWQVITSSQLLLVVGLSALLLNNATWQPILLFTTIIVALALHSSVGPYALLEDNIVVTISMMSVALVYLSNFATQHDHSHSVAVFVSVVEGLTLFVLFLLLAKPVIVLGLSFFGVITKEIKHQHKKRKHKSMRKKLQQQQQQQQQEKHHHDDKLDHDHDDDDDDDDDDNGGHHHDSDTEYRLH